MGCNFYTIKNIHVGKRYADGVWCWDCRVRASRDRVGFFWFCHNCGNRTSDETLIFNPAMRELGFNKTKYKNHSGVDGASGFIWAYEKEKFKRCKKFKNEYGDVLSAKDFWLMFKDIINEQVSDSEPESWS